MSAVGDLSQCEYRWYLKRVCKVTESPAGWLPQGLAVHDSVEALERSERSLSEEETVEVFRDSYERHTNRLCDTVRNWGDWTGSGPRYPPQMDVERRFHLGEGQTSGYWHYVRERGSQEPIWTTPDGTPAVELPFAFRLGTVLVKGFLDQVVLLGGNPHMRDVKTGKLPGGEFQLSVYAAAMLALYGVEITTGDFWMAQQGKPTIPYELKNWDTARLTEYFEAAKDTIEREEFPARPEKSKCWTCPVRAACEYRAR